jgi:hypothetical protein
MRARLGGKRSCLPAFLMYASALCEKLSQHIFFSPLLNGLSNANRVTIIFQSLIYVWTSNLLDIKKRALCASYAHQFILTQ